MTAMRQARRAVRWLAAGLGVVAAGYAATAGFAWARYGHSGPPGPGEADTLLDGFMPQYEIAERHSIRVAAAADVTLAAAAAIDLEQSSIVSGIIRTRELVLGAGPGARARPAGLLAQMTSLGWGVLATVPGREIVVGSVTRPWMADVVFRAIPPGEFKDFHEPGYVKIVWTLRADPVGPSESIFRTETRVITTDPVARTRFRWYWARFSPGIVLIRRALLGQVKTAAERR